MYMYMGCICTCTCRWDIHLWDFTPAFSYPVQSDSQVNLLENSSTSQDPPQPEQALVSSEAKSLTTSTDSSEAKRPSSQQSGSQEPLIQSETETEVRSKDPSHGMPTLEAADSVKVDESGGERPEGEEGGYASVKKGTGEYDYVDKVEDAGQDEAGYAYARVGGAMGMGPANAGGGDDGSNKDAKDRVAALPSYGKVTRHMIPESKHGSYSEVRPMSSPILPPGRPRAVTEPIEPSNAGHVPAVRDDRAFTESAAHLPLPQIPNVEVSDETYDQIPEDLRENVVPAAGSGGGSASVAKSKGAPIRESLYEEVTDDMKVEGEEDTYESVPEDIRQSSAVPPSPTTLSPSTPNPPPPRSPSLTFRSTEAATPPSPQAPLAKSKDAKDEDDGKKKGKEHAKSEQKKHKALSKAKSDTGTESRGRSLSSFFSRKKGGSVVGGNAPASPKHKKEKDQQEPLPKVPTEGSMASPSHHLLPPSPPPMPAPLPPDEEEEDDPPDSAYDMIDVINPRGSALLKAANAKKSASLPASMRTAGASVFHPVDHGPLPDVPEESGGVVVSRQRVKEAMDPEYDTVVLGQVTDDPNYDSVQIAREDAMPKLEPADPNEAEGEQDRGATPTNKYAKVTSHTGGAVSPDHSALPPEHDDLGYAVIPAYLKMRKRAQSDAMKKKEEVTPMKKLRSKSMDDPEYDTVVNPSQAAIEEASGTDLPSSPSPPMEPEYESVTDEMREKVEAAAGEEIETPYASVDMAAKRRSQMLKQLSGGAYAGDLDAENMFARSTSPNPPPLPQQGDLGDLSEFDQPPIPAQLEDSLQLIEPSDPPYSRIGEVLDVASGGVVNPYSQIDVLQDPPYASIKKKSENEQSTEEATEEDNVVGGENPYATVDNVREDLEATNSNDPPYAKVEKGRVVEGKEDSGPAHEATDSELPGEGGENNATTQDVNGEQCHKDEDDLGEGTYNRLHHGVGNTAACRAPARISASATSPGGENEYATLTVDFQNSTSPELIVTPADGISGEVNGVNMHTEEESIAFTD